MGGHGRRYHCALTIVYVEYKNMLLQKLKGKAGKEAGRLREGGKYGRLLRIPSMKFMKSVIFLT